MTSDLLADKLDDLEKRIAAYERNVALIVERLDAFDVMTFKLFDLLQEIQSDIKDVAAGRE